MFASNFREATIAGSVLNFELEFDCKKLFANLNLHFKLWTGICFWEKCRKQLTRKKTVNGDQCGKKLVNDFVTKNV